MRDREREKGRGTEQREKQASCREPDVGLEPGSPESCSGPKAGAKPLSHPRIPMVLPTHCSFHLLQDSVRLFCVQVS